MSEDATNLDPVDQPAADPGVEPEAEESQEAEAAEGTETDDESTDQSTEPDTVEVEMDGQMYEVPVALKDSFMKAADYTQKTQELAEQRRQAAEELQKQQDMFQQQTQAHRQHIALYGKLEHTDALLEQFNQIDWVKLHQDNPDEAQQLGFQRETLRDQRDALEEEIERREHESRVVAEREYADRRDRLEATLAREIPNYSPNLRKEMDQTAIRGGFNERELAMVTDPRMIKMLHLAHLGEQVLKRQTAPKPTKPVKPVTKVTGGKTPDSGPTDKQDIKGWMERRNRELNKRRAG